MDAKGLLDKTLPPPDRNSIIWLRIFQPMDQLENISRFLISAEHPLVVGVGSRLRMDDSVGTLIAEELSKRYPEHVLIAGESFDLLIEDVITTGATHVLVIDAMDLGLAHGEVRVWEIADPSNGDKSSQDNAPGTSSILRLQDHPKNQSENGSESDVMDWSLQGMDVLSTHRLPLLMGIHYAKLLAPSIKVLLIGIQVRDAGFGASLSPEVRRAKDRIISVIADALHAKKLN